jgi:hypothetical protein
MKIEGASLADNVDRGECPRESAHNSAKLEEQFGQMIVHISDMVIG